MTKKVRKAVIPAAGFGTRFLPFTKSVPKELIPVVDKPVIQYVLEEAEASGIEEVLIILSRGKSAIRNHFSPAEELEKRLEESKKEDILRQLRQIGGNLRISYTMQEELNGLGGAILLAKEFVGDEFFAVLLGDTILTSANDTPVTGQLIELHKCCNSAVVAVEEVAPELVSRYGIVGGEKISSNALMVNTMVEKPSCEDAPSNLAVASRYLLSPGIFAELEVTPRGKGNEIQLTDAMRSLLKKEPLAACIINGTRHDIGDKLSFLKNTVEFALKRPEYRDEFMKYLKSVIEKEK